MTDTNYNLMGRLRTVIDKHSPLAAQLYRLLRHEIYYHRLPAVKTPEGFLFYGDNAMQTGNFEPAETEIIKQYLANADILVDVGANTGFYSCLAKKMGKYAVAIEPHPQNLRQLYRNLDENKWQDVEVWPVGLAEKSGIITLYGGNTGASVVKGWAENPDSWKQRVPVHTMDLILGSRFNGKRIVIKVDVEGAEYEVLQGALKVLNRVPKPVWLMEATLKLHHPGVNQHFMQTFEIFWGNGYEARTGDDSRQLISREIVERWVRQGACDFGTHNWLFLPNV